MKKTGLVLLGILLLGAVLASGCAGQRAKDGDTVTVNYTLTLEDGTVYATSSGGKPLQFTLGDGKLLPGFEDAVVGMRVGDKKTVTLPPDKAYGPHYSELVAVFSKSQLPDSVPPEVGQRLQVTGKDGTPVPAVITAVSGDTVTVDGNSPLAGKTLTFDIELVAIGENAAPAPSGLTNQTGLIGALGAVVVVAAGSTIFYLRRRPQRVRVGPRRQRDRSEALLAELARLDEDFKITEEAYHKARARKKAELVKLMERSKEANGNQ